MPKKSKPSNPVLATLALTTPRKSKSTTTIPHEVLAMVAAHLHSSPRHIFILLKSAKFLRSHFTPQWWHRFWEQHKIIRGGTSNLRHFVLRNDAFGPLRVPQYSHMLRLGYSLRCECCGARWHHSVNVLLKLRICNMCKFDNFVSNRVLYYTYGLRASDLINTQGHLLNWMPLDDYRYNALKQITTNPIDFEGFTFGQHQRLVFLWLPDIKALYDLPALRSQQIQRKAAACTLAALFRRAHTKNAVWTEVQRFDKAGKIVKTYAIKRHAVETLTTIVRQVITPGQEWIPGGPFKSLGWYFTHKYEPDPSERHGERIRIMNKFRTYAPRPFVGFGETTPKHWLSKFGNKFPPPLDIPLPVQNQTTTWTYPQPIYSVATLQRITVTSE